MLKRIAFLVASIIFTNISFAVDCYPPLDPTKDQFLIGYGSLISTASKNSTYDATGPNLPVMVQGFKRAWIAKGSEIGFSTTYLGITKQATASMNAVIFKIPTASHIKDYDARESHYCRLAVDSTAITRLDETNLPKGQYWIYLTAAKDLAPPSARFPIVQSYVDVFLSGCMEIGKQYNLINFAANCISTTSGWSTHWVNDRIMPRRPFVHESLALQIDKLLNEYVGKEFAAIRIE